MTSSMPHPPQPTGRLGAMAETFQNIKRRAQARLLGLPGLAQSAQAPERLPLAVQYEPAAQPAQVVWLDACPEWIQAHERYHYQLDISEQAEFYPIGSPHAEVRIQVPYDGFRHFPRSAARRLEEQAAIANSGAVYGQVGWLAVGLPLDWEHTWGRQAGADIEPVHIPLRGETLLRPEQWVADEVQAVVRYTYSPSIPPFQPLRLDVHVYDDQAACRHSLREHVDALRNGRLLDEPCSAPGWLAIDITLAVAVPAALCAAQVQLERLELAWPTIAPPWQLQVHQLLPSHSPSAPPECAGHSQALAWHYNPDHSSVELCNVRLQPGNLPGDSQASSPLVSFTCVLRLWLCLAGQLVSQDEIHGALRVRLDGVLLSGREMVWLKADGRRAPQQGMRVCHQTILEAEFTACLSERFDHRHTATYRRWRFPGIGLSVDRLAELAGALRDLGYQVHRQSLAEDGHSSLLLATRTVPPTSSSERVRLEIEVLAERSAPVRARHERETPAGVHISAELESCDLVLHLRGQTRGHGSAAALDVDRLMSVLKKRWVG